jgi:hypothetical protein
MGRGLAVLGAIATPAALVVATTGSAALKTKSASVALAAGESGSATAKRRRGSEAVSGGFALPSRFSVIFESLRAGKRQWTVAGRPGLGPDTLMDRLRYQPRQRGDVHRLRLLRQVGTTTEGQVDDRGDRKLRSRIRDDEVQAWNRPHLGRVLESRNDGRGVPGAGGHRRRVPPGRRAQLDRFGYRCVGRGQPHRLRLLRKEAQEIGAD